MEGHLGQDMEQIKQSLRDDLDVLGGEPRWTPPSLRRALQRAPPPSIPRKTRTWLHSRKRSLLVRRSGSGLRALKPHGVTRRRQSLLGRSQAVRQRILIPPFPGSIPGAPAKFSRI